MRLCGLLIMDDCPCAPVHFISSENTLSHRCGSVTAVLVTIITHACYIKANVYLSVGRDMSFYRLKKLQHFHKSMLPEYSGYT